MHDGVRITYCPVFACLAGDCPGLAATSRTSIELDAVVHPLAEQHPDLPTKVERIENPPEPGPRRSRAG